MTAPAPRLSAHSLKEFDRCERKFALRYAQHAFWPGTPPEVEEERGALALGEAFHLLVQVHALGLDVTPMLGALPDADGRLTALWSAFKGSSHALPTAGERRWTEQALNLFVGGIPTFVRYDRLVERDGKWTILDWKTGRVKPEALASDWQTRLYRFALVAAGEHLGAGPIAPEQVTIVYWEVSSGKPLPFAYSQAQYEADGRELAARAAHLQHPFNPKLEDDPHYPANRGHCKRCDYYSLCNRVEADLAAPGAIRAPTFL
ncbi:MAG: hypothetical protein JWM80_3613 [Cyanobacteria bacterium RYN_339]|nr:hypothetical protein [Cyanobacteria bacterium RYN_339]